MRVKLQKLREASGHTQQSFSTIIGISRSHYSQIETGEKEPSLRVGLKIKKALLTRKAPFRVIDGRNTPNSVIPPVHNIILARKEVQINAKASHNSSQ